MNYNSLMNKPTINYRELIGDNSVTEVGGITEEEFNTLMNTDLASYYTKTQIDELFARSYVFRDKSGGIATFDCPTSTPAFAQILSEIVAVQDLHGYDNPWVGGAGKNKINLADITTPSAGFVYNRKPINVVVNTYTLSFNFTGSSGSISISLRNGETVVSTIQDRPLVNGLNTYTMPTLSDNADSISLYSSIGGTYENFMLEIGSQATTYEPYSNICPFSGWSAVNVIVSPTLDAEDGTTYTTQLKDGQGNPMTCYGGGLMNAGGSQALIVTKGHIASYNGETLPSTWLSDRDVYAAGTTPSIGAEVVYELETQLQIPQDSLSIVSTGGINKLWCNSGDITVRALDKIIQG